MCVRRFRRRSQRGGGLPRRLRVGSVLQCFVVFHVRVGTASSCRQRTFFLLTITVLTCPTVAYTAVRKEHRRSVIVDVSGICGLRDAVLSADFRNVAKKVLRFYHDGFFFFFFFFAWSTGKAVESLRSLHNIISSQTGHRTEMVLHSKFRLFAVNE